MKVVLGDDMPLGCFIVILLYFLIFAYQQITMFLLSTCFVLVKHAWSSEATPMFLHYSHLEHVVCCDPREKKKDFMCEQDVTSCANQGSIVLS